MKQLRDEDLVDRIVRGEIVKSGMPKAYSNLNSNDPKWYEKESPVQSSSLDLHVGEIHVVDKSKSSRDYYCLRAGQTVVVITSEELTLSSRISGFGFPPDKLSHNGVLMANFGHVDPGWVGRLKFVLINAGKEDFPIEKGDVVATFLFYELDDEVKSNYQQRRPNGSIPNPPDVSKLLNKLSKDFLDIESRADKIVKKSVNYFTCISSLVGAVTVGIIALFGFFVNRSWEKTVNDIEKEVISIKKDYEYNKLKAKVDSMNVVMNLNHREIVKK